MDCLPFELLEIVVSFLDTTSDVASMRSVCRLFKDACMSSSAPLVYKGAKSRKFEPKTSLPWKKSTRLKLSNVNLTHESAVQFLTWVRSLELDYCKFDKHFVFPCNIKKLHIKGGCKFYAQNPLTFQNLTVLNIHLQYSTDHQWLMPDMPNIQELGLYLSADAFLEIRLPDNAPMLKVLRTAGLRWPITLSFYPLLETVHCKDTRVNFGMHQPSLKYVHVNRRFPINAIDAPLLKELHIETYYEQDWDMEYNFTTTSFQLDKLYINRANVSGLERLYNASCYFDSCLFVDLSGLLYMKNIYLKTSESKWTTSSCDYYDVVSDDVFHIGD
jgi:hypothetical protein